MTYLEAAAGSIGGGTLAAYVALGVSILTPLIAVLNAWSGRKTRRERNAAAWSTEAQGGAIASGTPLEWRTTDHQALLDERSYAEKTRGQLVVAESEVRTLRDQVAECERRMDAMQEDMRQLRTSIAGCAGGPPCPLRPVAMPSPLTVPPPEG